MRNRVAAWLRKLATRLDGELYLAVSPRLKGAVREMLKDELTKRFEDALKLNQPADAGEQPRGIKGQQPLGVVYDEARQIWEDEVPYRDHQGRACCCAMPGEPLTSGTKHLPMCPLYRGNGR